MYVYISDTPQNSPHHQTQNHDLLSTSSTATTMSAAATLPHTSLNNGASASNVVPPTYRTRRLSNSSMASDVSFRLPTYDSPAIYHLQSDMESASEFEDSQIANSIHPHLELISKEQLHQAYRKALEKYQKYRTRYSDVAKRYRDLERDNNKARVSEVRQPKSPNLFAHF